jgi:hypothetical protein
MALVEGRLAADSPSRSSDEAGGSMALTASRRPGPDFRARLDREGFVLLRGLIPVSMVEELRENVYRATAQSGLVERRVSDPAAFHLKTVDGNLDRLRARPFVRPVTNSATYRAVNMHVIHALAAQVGPLRLVEEGHGRWLRIGMPRDLKRGMPPHQDIFYMRKGEDFVTVWVPLHSCPPKLGGVRLVPRSHQHGPFFHDGKRGIPVRGHGLRWRQFSFDPGDALVFHRHLVHASGRNRTEDQVRFSVDFRLMAAT